MVLLGSPSHTRSLLWGKGTSTPLAESPQWWNAILPVDSLLAGADWVLSTTEAASSWPVPDARTRTCYSSRQLGPTSPSAEGAAYRGSLIGADATFTDGAIALHVRAYFGGVTGSVSGHGRDAASNSIYSMIFSFVVSGPLVWQWLGNTFEPLLGWFT